MRALTSGSVARARAAAGCSAPALSYPRIIPSRGRPIVNHGSTSRVESHRRQLLGSLLGASLLNAGGMWRASTAAAAGGAVSEIEKVRRPPAALCWQCPARPHTVGSSARTCHPIGLLKHAPWQQQRNRNPHPQPQPQLQPHIPAPPPPPTSSATTNPTTRRSTACRASSTTLTRGRWGR